MSGQCPRVGPDDLRVRADARGGLRQQVPASALFDAAEAGDPRAISIRDAFVGRVADAVRLIALAVDPEAVVLGGGVAQVGERLRSGVADALAEQAAASSFLRSLELPDRLELVPQDVPVAALGAALLGRAER